MDRDTIMGGDRDKNGNRDRDMVIDKGGTMSVPVPVPVVVPVVVVVFVATTVTPTLTLTRAPALTLSVSPTGLFCRLRPQGTAAADGGGMRRGRSAHGAGVPRAANVTCDTFSGCPDRSSRRTTR